MPQSRSLDRITTIRFQVEATVDHVIARLFESVKRTDLSLLSLAADGERVYPLVARSPTTSASSWRADLLWREAPLDVNGHMEIFLHRAELFLDLLPPGVHVVDPAAPRRRSGRTRRRERGAYGLDGSFYESPTTSRES
jgi:hypothetical protein